MPRLLQSVAGGFRAGHARGAGEVHQVQSARVRARVSRETAPTRTITTECDRLERAFIAVAPVDRFASPSHIAAKTSSASRATRATASGTLSAAARFRAFAPRSSPRTRRRRSWSPRAAPAGRGTPRCKSRARKRSRRAQRRARARARRGTRRPGRGSSPPGFPSLKVNFPRLRPFSSKKSVFGARRPGHSVRLARARLAVRQQAHVVPVRDASDERPARLVHLSLARRRAERAVEREAPRRQLGVFAAAFSSRHDQIAFRRRRHRRRRAFVVHAGHRGPDAAKHADRALQVLDREVQLFVFRGGFLVERRRAARRDVAAIGRSANVAENASRASAASRLSATSAPRNEGTVMSRTSRNAVSVSSRRAATRLDSVCASVARASPTRAARESPRSSRNASSRSRAVAASRAARVAFSFSFSSRIVVDASARRVSGVSATVPVVAETRFVSRFRKKVSFSVRRAGARAAAGPPARAPSRLFARRPSRQRARLPPERLGQALAFAHELALLVLEPPLARVQQPPPRRVRGAPSSTTTNAGREGRARRARRRRRRRLVEARARSGIHRTRVRRDEAGETLHRV